jgi:hypothetical protein
MTKPKERPILFSGPMVRAILDGRKTQTRRTVKPQPPIKEWFQSESGQDCGFFNCKPNEWRMSGAVGVARSEMGPVWPKDYTWRCPYGPPGDRLWVRETHCKYGGGFIYRADYGNLTPISDGIGGPWKPSIHMPRWASRITLEITGVSVERVHDITNADCVAEGIEPIGDELIIKGTGFTVQAGRLDDRYSTVRQLYSELWESINGPGSWNANPWVWVVEFAKVDALTAGGDA